MALAQAWNHTCSKVGLACRNGDAEELKHLLSENQPVDVKDNRGWIPLHEAAFHNQLNCLEILLKHDSSHKNWCTFEGETAIFLAASEGHVEILRTLLRYKANLKIGTPENKTPLLVATRCSSLECIDLLLEHGANILSPDCSNWSTLHVVAENGNATVAQHLLKHGATIGIFDDNQRTPIFIAAEHGHLEVLKCLIEKANEMSWPLIDACAIDGATPMMLAVQNGHVACVELLLEHGADPNLEAKDGVMSIHLATQFNKQCCMKLLLNRMSEATLNDFRQATLLKRSPFHIAIEWKRADIIDLFLKEGFNVNVIAYKPNYVNDGQYYSLSKYFTPLGLAAEYGQIETMQKLIAAGSDVRGCQGERGMRSPLISAIIGNHYDAVKLLADHGATSKCKNALRGLCERCSNLKPLYTAFHLNNTSIADLLLKSGMDLNIGGEDPALEPSFTFMLLQVCQGKTFADFDKLFMVLWDHLTYTNYNNMMRDICLTYSKDTKLVDHLVSLPHSPHSLQHMCRLNLRIMMKLKPTSYELLSRQLQLPEVLCNYLLFKC